MEYLQLFVFYIRHSLFNIADAITNLFLRQGVEITVFPSDVALIMGLIVGYVLNPSFKYLRIVWGGNSIYRSNQQPITIEGKTKDEVRRAAKRSL
jgi:hypothetical protein